MNALKITFSLLGGIYSFFTVIIMRGLLFLLLNFAFVQQVLSQNYNDHFRDIEKMKQYLSANINSLDRIEGIYDVNRTISFASGNKITDHFAIAIIKKPFSRVFDFYSINIDMRGNLYEMTLSKGTLIYATQETNVYEHAFFTTHTKFILNSNNNFSFTEKLDATSEKEFAYGKYHNIAMTYDCIKVFPEKPHEQNFTSPNKPTSWSGTGFALNNGYVITNYHVVEEATSIVLKGVGGNTSIGYNAIIVAFDRNNDLAILRISDRRFTNFGTIPYKVNTTTSEVGEEVFVLGYPLTATMGDEIKLTTGVISSKSGFQGDISQYQISAPVQPGNSGGPLFDSKGNIIGIVSAKHAGAENVGYAIKTSYLKSLVESVTSTNVLPQANRIATQNLSGKVKAVKNYVYYITCTR